MSDMMSEPVRGDRRSAPFPKAPILCGRGAPEESWIDYNDHMNIGYYLIAIDRATDDFFEDWIGIGPMMVEEAGMGSFVLQSHMHFLREIRRGQSYDAHIQLLDHDAKRWRYIATLTNLATGEKAATAEQIAISVDHASRRAAPLPCAQFERLEAMMTAHRDLPLPPEVGAPLGIRRAKTAP